MKKSTKNVIGLVLIGTIYVLIIMPILMGEQIRLPNINRFAVMLLWITMFLLSSFLIPGIIALIEYTNKKTFWRYFYYTGWTIYISILILFSIILSNHSMG